MKFSTVLNSALLATAVCAEAEAHTPTTTVTVVKSGAEVTHKFGRFNNTHHETTSSSTSTGTHKFGRFNNTHHETTSSSTSTGTHKFGKFNNTHHEQTTTTVYEGAAANAAVNPFVMKNSVVAWSAGAVGCAAAALLL